VSSYDLMVGEATVAQASMMTDVPRVALVPSTLDLLGVEQTISQQPDRAFKLRNAFKALDEVLIEGKPVTYVIIDCPPSLNLLTVNALVAADAVLVPMQCEFFALEGLSQLLQTIDQIRTTLNPRLKIQGVVMTMFDKRNSLSEQVLQDVRGTMGSLVYDTVIPRNVRLSEAPSYGKPALLYDLKCAGSQAYLRLATEVIRRERQLNAA
jgi:chromosome partitioning protein